MSILDAYGAQYEEPNRVWGWLKPDTSPLLYTGVTDTLTWNWPPHAPATPTGGPGSRIKGVKGQLYTFSTRANDPDGNNVGYWFNWGDGILATFFG